MNIIIHLKCVPIGALGPPFEGLKGIFSQRSLKIELIKNVVSVKNESCFVNKIFEFLPSGEASVHCFSYTVPSPIEARSGERQS